MISQHTTETLERELPTSDKQFEELKGFLDELRKLRDMGVSVMTDPSYEPLNKRNIHQAKEDASRIFARSAV